MLRQLSIESCGTTPTKGVFNHRDILHPLLDTALGHGRGHVLDRPLGILDLEGVILRAQIPTTGRPLVGQDRDMTGKLHPHISELMADHGSDRRMHHRCTGTQRR